VVAVSTVLQRRPFAKMPSLVTSDLFLALLLATSSIGTEVSRLYMLQHPLLQVQYSRGVAWLRRLVGEQARWFTKEPQTTALVEVNTSSTVPCRLVNWWRQLTSVISFRIKPVWVPCKCSDGIISSDAGFYFCGENALSVSNLINVRR